MTHTLVRFGDDAREGVMRGVETMANAVKATLGPRGRTVLIRKGYAKTHICNDGVTVAKAVELADPVERAGAEVVREAAAKTGELAGDGTTTAAVLAQAIAREGVKAVAAGFNPMDLRRGIDAAVTAVVADMKSRARKIDGRTDIAQVGTIAANGDRAVGEMVADAMEKVGPEGAVTIEEAKGLETELEIVEGLQFDRGYLSPYFITEVEHMSCVLDDPAILIHEKKLSDLKNLLPLLEKIVGANRPLLIIAEDLDSEVLATLVVNKLRGGLKVAAVKAPGFGERRKAMLEDIAVVTGGQFLSEELGLKLENVTLEMLGAAKRVSITKDDTTIIDGAGAKTDIDARLKQLREQIKEATSDYDKVKLEERLAKLAGGVAVIRAGGATELDVKDRKDRVDDAVHATRAAVEEGVVAGGGSALIFAARSLDGVNTENDDQAAGVAIVKRALEAPAREIAFNAGLDGALIVAKLRESSDPNYGYDAQRAEWGDLVAVGVIDPVKVVRLALQNAASVAGMLITTEVLVIDEPEKALARGADMEDFAA
jgi:chaperonin GroEL